MRDRGYEPLTEIGREMLHKGRAEGRVATVRELCEASGVAWTDAHAAAVAGMTEEEIGKLVRALVRDRAWPSH